MDSVYYLIARRYPGDDSEPDTIVVPGFAFTSTIDRWAGDLGPGESLTVTMCDAFGGDLTPVIVPPPPFAQGDRVAWGTARDFTGTVIGYSSGPNGTPGLASVAWDANVPDSLVEPSKIVKLPEECIHPGVFATGRAYEMCWTCGHTVPRSQL